MTRAAVHGWLALGALALAGCSVPPTQRDRIADLAAAERAFAAMARTDGVRAAFLDAMADDATLFRPGPVNGKAFYAAAPDAAIRLAWEPRRVAVAGSGEVGYSSGPYRLTPSGKPDTPSYGQFMTVWRRVDGGPWKVFVDHGIGHAQPVVLDRAVEAIEGDGSRAAQSITVAEADFARASATRGLFAAYRAHGASRMRLLRDDLEPLDGTAGLDRLPEPDGRWTWIVTDSGTGKSEDLAWTIGRYRPDASKAPGSGGTFVRVWLAERGDWKILAEVLAPSEDPAR